MSELTSSKTPEEEAVRQAAAVVQVVTLIAVLFTALAVYLTIQTGGAWQAYQFIILAAQVIVASLVSVNLIRSGRPRLGAWIVFISNLIAPVWAALLISKLGYVALAYILVTVYFTILYVMPNEAKRTTMLLAIFGLVITLLTELINPAWRLVSPLMLIASPILTTLLGIIFFMVILRQAWSGNIRTRLVTSFLIFVIVPLVFSGLISSLLIRQAAQTDTYNHLSSSATLKEDSVNAWVSSMSETLKLVFHTYEETDIVHALLELENEGSNTQSGETDHGAVFADTTNDLLTILSKTVVFDEIFILDQNGQVVVSTDETQVGKLFANQSFFQEGLKGEYVQPPQYSQSLGEVIVYASKPLLDEHGHAGGVVAGRANLDLLNEIMLADIGIGNTGETYLVRSNNALLTASRFEGYTAGDTYIRTEGVNTAIQEKSTGTTSYVGYRGTPVLGAYRWLPDLELALVAEVDQTEALQTAVTSTFTSLGVAVIAALLAIGAAFFVTQTIATPLGKLANAAERITAGELDIVVQIERQDEIGVLAETFNSMTTQLRETLEGLEQRVTDRTRALETSTEVSRRLSTILDQRQLVREVVDQVQTAFNYYHAHIYLFDEQKENLMMVGGTGDAGQAMLAQGHTIPKGRGLVGRAADTNLPVLVPDVTQAEGWLPNPLLPDTKAEVAIPISLGSNVLGVLDVQDDEVGELNEGDVELLQSIANQVAIAIQNARAYQGTQQQVAREALITHINQQIQSTTDIEDALKIAVRELGRALGTQTSVKLKKTDSGNGQKIVQKPE